MKFFLDENFPMAAVGLLEGMGHEVFDLRGSGREGLPDPDIFAEAQLSAAVFLTTDRDFFHTIPHNWGHSGDEGGDLREQLDVLKRKYQDCHEGVAFPSS